MEAYCIADRIPEITKATQEPGYFFAGSSVHLAQLLWVCSGTLHCVYDGQDHLLQPGGFLLLPPDHWCMYYAQPEASPHLLKLSFSATLESFSPIFEEKADVSLNELLEKIDMEQATPDAVSREMTRALLNQLLLQLYRQQRFIPAQPVAGEAAIVTRAQKVIGNYAHQKLSVPLVAQRVQISPSYLTALFQKRLNISPGEYIRRVKLQVSKELIREGKMNFTEIAAALEYSTVHHFSRQFREKFGITPSDYAKTVRSDEIANHTM